MDYSEQKSVIAAARCRSYPYGKWAGISWWYVPLTYHGFVARYKGKVAWILKDQPDVVQYLEARGYLSTSRECFVSPEHFYAFRTRGRRDRAKRPAQPGT